MRLERTLPLPPPTPSKIDLAIERADENGDKNLLTEHAVEFNGERRRRQKKQPQQSLPESYKPHVHYGAKAEIHEEDPSLTDVDLLA